MKKLILLIIPILILLNINFSNKKEFWDNKYDPEYCYLLNGLNLAYQYGNIGLYQHPGSTVHIMTAMIIKTTYKFRNTENNMPKDVLLNPEVYLNAIGFVFTLFNCLLIFFIGMIVAKNSENIAYGLLFQSVSFISITAIENGFYRVSPEPLLFGACVLLVALFMLRVYFNKSFGIVKMDYSNTNKEIKLVNIDVLIILIAVVIGFCFATKINTLPLVLLPLFFMTNRNKIGFLWVIFIAFIIFTLPIASHYIDLIKWIKDLFIHSGNYGSGEKNILNLSSFSVNFGRFMKNEYVLFYTMLLSIFFLIRQWIQKKRDLHFKILLAVFIVQTSVLLMVLKHFEFRYLLPIYPTIGISLFMFLRMLNFSRKKESFLIYPFIIICIGCNFFLRTIEEPLKKPLIQKGIVNIYSAGCSSPIFALKFGDDFANNANAKMLVEIYGKQYFYNIWDREFLGWNSTTLELNTDSLVKNNEKVYFYGNKIFLKAYKPDFKLKSISENRFLFK